MTQKISTEKEAVLDAETRMREDARSRRVVLVCHCLLDGNAKVWERARYSGDFTAVTDIIQKKGYGILQLPCPELLYFGANRYWGGKNVFDSAGFRRFCREKARETADYIENYNKVGVKAVCVIGCDGSPTCGVSHTNFYDNGGGRPKTLMRRVIPGKGIFMEELEKELKERNLPVPDFVGLGMDLFSDSTEAIVEEFRKYMEGK